MEDQHAQWYPDPWGRHEQRFYDGQKWTEHVASHGKQSIDPPSGDAKHVEGNVAPERIREQIADKAGIASDAKLGNTGHPILDASVLVVNQKTKIIELNNEYAIYDAAGSQIGSVRQVGQSKAKKVVRALTSFDQYMTHKFQLVDHAGNVMLALTRPAKFVKSRVVVQDGTGSDIGELVQENVFGKIRFGMVSNGQQVGSLNAENWRAWNFSITDHTGAEVARITKTWEGLAKTLFTTADNYVVKIHRELSEPLRSLVLAAAVTVDTALKQDSRGLG